MGLTLAVARRPPTIYNSPFTPLSVYDIFFSFDYRISDLEVQDQPIEDTIRQIYEGQLLYNHFYDKEDPAS